MEVIPVSSLVFVMYEDNENIHTLSGQVNPNNGDAYCILHIHILSIVLARESETTEYEQQEDYG